MMNPEPDRNTLPNWQWPLIVLAIIFAVGAALRFYDLGNTRKGIYPDESLYGYDGLSIAQTGTDHRQSGRPPLFLIGHSQLWDNRTSILYPYILAGLFQVLPATTWVERLPAAAAGTFFILAVFLLARSLFPNRPWLAVAAAGLVATLPQAIAWSRVGHDPILMPTLAVTAFWLMTLTPRRPWWWLVSGTLLAVGMYGYQPFKLVAPLLGLLGAWYMWPTAKTQRRWLLGAAGTALMLVGPLLWVTWTHPAVQSEWSRISIFTAAHPWSMLARKVWWLLTGQLLLKPQLNFLFIWPAFLVGMVILWRRHRRLSFLFSAWLVIGLMPALLTRYTSDQLSISSRTLALVGILEIGGLCGFDLMWQWLRRRWLPTFRQRLVAALYAATVAMVLFLWTWLANANQPAWCCFFDGGLDQAVAILQQPRWAHRPVTLHTFSQNEAENVLWLSRYSPAAFQREPVGYTSYAQQYGDVALGLGEFPSTFGRYNFCDVRQCFQPHDGRLYVVPNDLLLSPPAVAQFRLSISPGLSPQLWKIVENI